MFSSLLSFSQEQTILTLEQSLSLALKNNPEIFIATQQLKIAAAKAKQARSFTFPQIDFGLSYQKTNRKHIFKYLNQEIELEPQDEYKTGFLLKKSLYDGGRVKASVLQAEANYLIAQAKLEKIKQELIYKTTEAYFDLLRLEKTLTCTQQAKKVIEKHYEQAKTSYQLGLLTKADLLLTELSLINIEQKLIEVKETRNLKMLSFKNLIGMDLGREVSLAELPLVEEEIREEPENFEKRPEYLEMEAQLTIAQAEVISQSALNKPSLFLGVDYSWWGNEFPPATGGLSLFIDLNYMLFDGGRVKSKIQSAKTSLEILQTSQKTLKKKFILEKKMILSSLTQLKHKIKSMKTNVKQAQENLRVMELQAEAGLISPLQLLSARNSLLLAENNLTDALYQLQITHLKYKKIIGQLEIKEGIESEKMEKN
jgi:outer membrane protein TolC